MRSTPEPRSPRFGARIPHLQSKCCEPVGHHLIGKEVTPTLVELLAVCRVVGLGWWLLVALGDGVNFHREHPNCNIAKPSAEPLGEQAAKSG